jgi:hypothetical protein
MNVDGLSGLVSRVIAWADGLQRRHGVLGFPYAVVKKYGDDEGGRQAALITCYGFLSIFPLLLLGVAVLSRVLAGHPDLRRRLIANARRVCLSCTAPSQAPAAFALVLISGATDRFLVCMCGSLRPSRTGAAHHGRQACDHRPYRLAGTQDSRIRVARVIRESGVGYGHAKICRRATL